MSEILLCIIVGFALLLPIILMAVDIVFLVKRKEKALFEFIAFVIGTVYMVLAYCLWDLPDYTESINCWDIINAHAPINTDYIIALILFGAWGFFSYLILKFCRKEFPPIVEVFLLAGVYAGVALCVVWLVQLLSGANPIQVDGSTLLDGGYSGQYIIELNSFDYTIIACLCIVPLIFILHCVCLLVQVMKERAEKQKTFVYENKLLNGINLFLCKGINLIWVAMICLLPILGVLTIILILFGQQPDSVILAFTKTSDWVLSKEISPPPVAFDTHYLCTVSLRGHKKLVKPIRFGLRRGEKIVVNRQLCVANAFEQLIEEKAPRFHKAVRHFYDTYGYPISKHINNAWAADIVYVIMKPLEWIFLFVLYLFDKNPENRIQSQYLPKMSGGEKNVSMVSKMWNVV